MGIVIDFNKKRKAKIRLEKQKTLAENRIKFGLSKRERQLVNHENERVAQYLDDHTLEKKEEN